MFLQQDDIECPASGPAETAAVPEASEEIANALAAGCWWAIVEAERPIDKEPQVDISSMRFWGNLEASGTSSPSLPRAPVPASVPEWRKPAASPVLKSQKKLSRAPVSAGSGTPAQVVESALGQAVSAVSHFCLSL